MDDTSLRYLRELTELSGPPSYEQRIRNYMREELTPFVDDIHGDRLGAIFGRRASTESIAPKVMLAAHMDEVGFIVSGVAPDGLVTFKPLGGWWSQTLLSQRVTLHADNGDLTGVIGTRAIRQALSPAEKSSALSIDDMVIDCGAGSAEELDAWGVHVGTFATPRSTFEVLNGGKRLLGKAFDNRYGCATAIDVARRLSGEALPCELYIGGTVQEEGGLRGASAAAQLVQPDLFIAVDSSAARDVSRTPRELGRLGEGFLLRAFDSRMRPDFAFREWVRSLADERGIPYQWFFSHGTTDAASVQSTGIGVPSIVIGIASRYNHSHSVIVDRADYDASLDIVCEIVRGMNRDTYDGLLP